MAQFIQHLMSIVTKMSHVMGLGGTFNFSVLAAMIAVPNNNFDREIAKKNPI